MRKTGLILLSCALLIVTNSTGVKAETKSVTLHVSCIIPSRLELSSPIEQPRRIEAEKIELQTQELPSSKIQSQQIKNFENQQVLVYTITER